MLIVKMAVDFGSMEATKANMLNLCDIDTNMGLPCIFPMLKSINVLMKFVKGKDYLYVITLQLSKFAKQTYIGCMVIQTHPSKLQTFMFIDVVVNTSCKIMQDWITNINDGIKHLFFGFIGQSHMVHSIDPLIRLHFLITHNDFETTIIVVKG
jgi:hypothetical protein